MTRALVLRMLATGMLAGLGMAATASPAHAQVEQTAPPATPSPTCDEGRVATDGYCCWPGQRWAAEHQQCEGAPSCPGELVGHGASCVARASALPSPLASLDGAPPPLEASYAEAARSRRSLSTFTDSTHLWPTSGQTSEPPTHRAFVGRGEDEGLIIAALVVFDVGWVLGWLGTMLGEIGGSCEEFSPFGSRRVSCDAWGWSFVPIGGSIMAGLVSHHGSRRNWAVGFGFGIPSVILQGIGAIMAIVAFSNETTEIVLQPIRMGGGLSASLQLGAPDSDAGLSVGITF